MKLATAQGITLALLFTGGLINYLDRAAFGLLAPQLSADLKLNAADMGIAFSIFSLGYAGFSLLGGLAADRFGAKRTLGVSMVLWSLFCAATGAVFSLTSLLVVRTLFGAGESPWGSAVNKTLSRWFSKERYASAYGIANSGMPLGGVVAGPLIAMLSVFVDWRWSFVAIALLGLGWAACWFWLSSDSPETHKWIDPGEKTAVARQRIQVDASQPEAETRFRSVTRPVVIGATVACFASSYFLYFFMSWFPSFLFQAHHMKLSDMSMASAVPWVLGVLGMASGGFVCDAAIRRLGNRLLALKVVLAVGLIVAAICVMLAGTAGSAASAVTYMTIGVGFMYIAAPTYFAIALPSVPSRNVGFVSGFMLLVSTLGGMVSPLVTGFMVRDTGSFAAAFYAAGFVALTGVAAAALLVREPRAGVAVPSSAAG